MDFSSERTLGWLAVLAALLVLGMLGIFAATGIGQDPLQYVHPAAEYAQLLTRNPPALRAAIGLDNLFVLVYSAVFVRLVAHARRQGAPRLQAGVALGLLLLVALLDLAENFHFLAMLASTEQGRPPTDAEIAMQAVESMFKFHVSYLGLLLLGLCLPQRNRRERLLAGLLVAVQAPVGVAIYVLPHALAVPLVFVRFAFFLAAFTLLASIHRAPPPLAPAAAHAARG